jgi:hypothetical protein
MAKIVLGVIIENLSTRSDGSLKIVLGSQEIDSTDITNVFSMRNKYVKALLSDNNISPLEEKMIDETVMQDGKKVKTKSQKLRACIYRLWEQKGGELDWETYYNNYMDAEIQKVKDQLE